MTPDPSALSDGPVDRCVCAHVTFEEFKRRAAKTGAAFDDLCKATGCGMGCGCCRLYLRLVLQSGRARLPVLGPADFRALGVV